MHFIRLIRPVNLLIIVLTMIGVRQYMLQFGEVTNASLFNFTLLVLSTVIIAAAGNMINDYFDMRADRVNRPESVIVGKYIKPRWAIVLHWMFNILAFCVGLYLGWYYQSFIFLIIHFSSITCLWWYSVSLKKKPVIGNLVVSSLTVLVIFLTQKFTAMDSLVGEQTMYLSHDRVFDIPSICIIWIFMGMAFVQNFAREIIKDAEDVDGDLVIGARTIPMIIGRTATIRLIGVLLVLFPLIYFTGVFFFFTHFNWIQALPITLAALTNVLAFVVALFSKQENAIVFIKGLLKLSMIFGIIYLFLPQ